MTFGASLKRLRMERGLSQEELARRLGTSKQAISRYENGARVPKISTVSALAAALESALLLAQRALGVCLAARFNGTTAHTLVTLKVKLSD